MNDNTDAIDDAVKKTFKIMPLYNSTIMTICDYFHSTGHGRFCEHIKTVGRIARTAAGNFQTESFHRWNHKHSSSRKRVTSSIKKKI